MKNTAVDAERDRLIEHGTAAPAVRRETRGESGMREHALALPTIVVRQRRYACSRSRLKQQAMAAETTIHKRSKVTGRPT